VPRRELQEVRALSALLNRTLGLVSELQPTEVLRRVVETACMLADARCGALVITGPRGSKKIVEVGTDPGALQDLTGGDMHGSAVHASVGVATPFLAVPLRSGRGFNGVIYITERHDGGTFTDDDEELIRSFASVAAAVIDNVQLSKEARQRELWVALHSEITTALLAGLSFAKVLDLVTRGARELIDADVATLCLLASSTALQVNASDGRGAEKLLGTTIELEGTVSGHVVSSGEPAILADAPNDPRRMEPILAQGGIDTAMVVPLLLQGQTTGALAVGRSVGNGPFSRTDFWLLESFATQISIALEYGQGRMELERLALLDDQERIARDLHDNVIQQLFATGMSLQATAQRIVDPGVAERVQQAIETLDGIIGDIRSTVFALRPPTSGRGSLRRSLMAVADQLQEPHDFTVHMTFDGPVDTTLDAEKEGHLVATLREALSNVARHAHARYVEVSLRADTEVVLRVIDDGVGIDVNAKRRSGLSNLKSRAERLHGTMTLSSSQGGGTTLEWRIPLEETPEPLAPRVPGRVSPDQSPAYAPTETSNHTRLPSRVRTTPHSVERASTSSSPGPLSSS
jgi:signal transduction histidine kinase